MYFLKGNSRNKEREASSIYRVDLKGTEIKCRVKSSKVMKFLLHGYHEYQWFLSRLFTGHSSAKGQAFISWLRMGAVIHIQVKDKNERVALRKFCKEPLKDARISLIWKPSTGGGG